MSDYARTIMRQYNNSPILLALLESFDQWVDMDKFTADFLYNVWDITTATGFALDIWGRILGRNRFVRVPRVENFGFDIGAEPGTNWQPFNQAPFWDGSPFGTTAVALQDGEYRRLLLLKAASNIASSDCPSINALMRSMFGTRGSSFVGYDPDEPMHIVYYFDFFPTPVERALIESGLFPQPAGTLATYFYRTLAYTPFGFAEMNSGGIPNYVLGFDQAPFYDPTN